MRAVFVAILATLLAAVLLGHAAAHDQIAHHLQHVVAEAGGEVSDGGRSDTATRTAPAYLADHADPDQWGHVDSARRTARIAVASSGAIQVHATSAGWTPQPPYSVIALDGTGSPRAVSRAALQVWRH